MSASQGRFARVTRNSGAAPLVQKATDLLANQILYGAAARQAIPRGVDGLANVVKVTLGPRGRNVILERKFGARMIKEVASKTSDIAGDGTTTATVLAQAIYREGVPDTWLPTLTLVTGCSGSVEVVSGGVGREPHPIIALRRLQ